MKPASPAAHFLSLARKNWKSGLTVALVSIPLSISLSIATNATPAMGIITAVWAGLVASIFGGSNFNIIGPAAALSGVLAGYVHTHGENMLPWVAIGSGSLILIVWILRWDKYILFIPGSVIHGFTLAVGLIIALNQLNFVLGLSDLPVHEAFLANIGESLRHIQDAQIAAVAVSLIGLVFLLVWNRYLPALPGPIPLAVIGIVLGFLTSKDLLPFSLQTLQTKFGVFDTALIQFPVFTREIFGRPFIATTFTVTLIAILETLLSAKIADGMTRTRYKQSPETLALGLANIVAGLFGGLPATGVLARTALNAKSGATHRISQGINAVSIAIICMLLLGQFIFLPLPIIAAILIYTAYRMVHHEHFVRLFRDHRTEFFLSIFVAAISVVFDPMIGILIGTSLAMMLFVQKISTGHAEVG
ncbi:MAG: inorganic anion transporter, sulfate permease (SulP) subfamily protein, partial [Candidatus Peregrinibacteria bacterium Greene1014_49]